MIVIVRIDDHRGRRNMEQGSIMKNSFQSARGAHLLNIVSDGATVTMVLIDQRDGSPGELLGRLVAEGMASGDASNAIFDAAVKLLNSSENEA